MDKAGTLGSSYRRTKTKVSSLCPDFVVELRSQERFLKKLQEKMQEYIDNGARLGWLIVSQTRRVEIARPDRDVEMLENSANLAGEDVLLGFTLFLKPVMQLD